MRYRIEPRADHLLVEVTGSFAPADARACVGEIGAACRAASLGRVLIDARGLDKPVSIAERFDLGAYLASQQFPLRIAVLVADAQMFTKTLEDTAVNRGTPLRTTASLDEARRFLGIQEK
jgi:G3E family GTPase